MSARSNSSKSSRSILDISLERFATTMRADYRFSPLNVLILISVFVVGLFVHLAVYDFSVEAVVLCLGSALALAVFIRLSQVWENNCHLGNRGLSSRLLNSSSEQRYSSVHHCHRAFDIAVHSDCLPVGARRHAALRPISRDSQAGLVCNGSHHR